ncbi:sensor histidine kinase [Enterococcus wangshanyuanii]|uniref:histidine kinase n=1 Tax=Enterococcus wangshanyuanii TaxID=2005703 RepID=A0ABQ1P224_9ENTE|nr:HAMP domain-containing sensor histidine kinase [Enterococcus wangshanyuanii]GGC89445.1 two-component sensor histidine kinase [Enterococcus wangshanyuanii]
MKKIRAAFQERKNTTQFQLTIWFIGLLVSAVLILSVLIIGITIAELYDSTEKQAVLLEDSLKRSEAEDEEDWEAVLTSYRTQDKSSYLIRVGLNSGAIIYSSEDAQEIYAEFPRLKQLFFLDQVLWTSEMEPYFYRSFEDGNGKVTMLVDMEDQFEVIGRIFSLTMLLTIVVIAVGSFVTYRFSKKLSGSLVVMNEEITKLESSVDEQVLTVPKTPQEVQNISRSFNQLLNRQRLSLKREQQFVTDASHELRTPLAAIRGHVNLIKRRGEKHPEVIPTSLSYIDKESKRMEILVNQLLTLGRLENFGEGERIDLSQLIQQTVDELSVMMTQELTVQIEAGIMITGQKEHFYQIARNLIENAMKYTEKNGQISIRLSSDAKQIYFAVEDSGMGIPDEAKEKVFERFYRVDQSRSSEIAGTGIGLAIVKSLVEHYNGTIQITDVQPEGTCFTVSFPPNT